MTGLNLDTIHEADLFDLCAQLDAGSVDMILADLPYGTTACSWDTVIPFDPMWAAFRRIIKPRGAIVLTASQPFTSALVMSWPQGFKYTWVWEKTNGTNWLNAPFQPLKVHEDVAVFSLSPSSYSDTRDSMAYWPKLIDGPVYKRNTSKDGSHQYHSSPSTNAPDGQSLDKRYPRSVFRFNEQRGLHPTQKPIDLFAYLIETYTQPGELVFDPTAGSGTTAVAARQTGRHYIVGDSSPEYVGVMRERLAKPYTLPMLELEVTGD
jgi:site-specific DNA-methyltransferase (adenine-specific)